MRSRPSRCYRCGAKRGLEGEGYFTRCADKAGCDARYDKQRQRSSQRSGVLVVFEAPNPPAELAEGICSWCSGELRNPDGAPLRGRARCWKDREGRDCQGDFNRSRQWKARDALRALARHEGRTALACVDCGQVVEEWGPTGSVDRETGEPRMGWLAPTAHGERVRVGPDWEADHDVALEDGGEHTIANLRVRCVPCHTRKTARENSARRRAA